MTPYDLGQAAVLLWQSGEKRAAADAVISYGLKGKLQLSKSGWLVLAVPNDIGIGAFKALNAPGAEMPISSSMGRYNAHISVMRPDEVQKIGADNITERGKELSFTLGPVREVDPAGWDEMNRCWFIQVTSPDLSNLRKSYGLTGKPSDGEHDFHITFAVRRRKVLRPGAVMKQMTRGSIIHRPDEFIKLSANKPITLPTKVTETVTTTKELCPHCDKEILEKSVYVDGEGYEYHRPCKDKGPIGRPFTAAQMKEWGHPDAETTKSAVNKNQDDYWDSPPNKDGRKCPGCGKLFKECEPLAGVKMCEVCERFGPRRVKEAAERGVEIKESPIDGKGLFATRNYEPGDVVVVRAMVKLPGEDGLTNYEQSDESRFTNHSNDANTALRLADTYVEFVAERPIAAGEEITGDYRSCDATLGPGFYLSYRGKRYDGESSSGRSIEDTSYISASGDSRVSLPADTSEDSTDISAALRGMWTQNYDPVHGVEETGARAAARKIGDADKGLPAPGHTGDGADRPGSLHADVANDAAADTTHAKSADNCSAKEAGSVRGTIEGLLDSSLAEIYSDIPPGIQPGSRAGVGDMGGVTGGMAGGGGGGARTRSGVSHGVPKSVDRPLTGLAAYEKQAAIEGASLAQQIATARRKTKAPASEAQAEAGNYSKGKVRLHGMTVAIENGKGSTRSGTDGNGKRWSVTMQHDYGYIHKTLGRDGDHVDVFIGPDPDVELVWVVNQYVDGKFDEHKCMMGFRGEQAARAGYLSNYDDGWQGLHSIVPMTISQFKEWLDKGDQSKPAAPLRIKKSSSTDWASRLAALQERRDPDGISTQQWDVAARATPMQYDIDQNVVTNFLQHMQKMRDHGMKQVAQQSQHDRLLNAADPSRSVKQLQAALADGGDHGRVPGRQFDSEST